MSALEQTASVAADYRHVEKIATLEPSLALDGTTLKWYEIAPDDDAGSARGSRAGAAQSARRGRRRPRSATSASSAS